MDNSPPANDSETVDRTPSWPKFSLLISVFLWLLAWEAIVWFVPIQPRLVIPSQNLETETSEYIMGFSPDGKTLVTSMDWDPNEPGNFYHLWDTRTGQDCGKIGNKDKNILPNVVYCGQRDKLRETFFPFNISETYVVYDLTSRQETATIQVKCGEHVESHLCFSPAGRTLAYSTNSKDKGELWLIEVATGRVRAHLQGEEFGRFDELVFSLDDRTFATAVYKTNPDSKSPDDDMVIVLDVASGRTSRTFHNYGALTRHPALSPDGKTFAIKCWHRGTVDLEFWDLPTGKQTGSFKAEGFDEFLPDGKGFAVWDQDSVRFCDGNTGTQYAVTNVSPATYGPGYGGLEDPVPIPGSHLLVVPSGTDWKPGLFFQWCARLLGIRNPGKREFESELAFLDTKNGHKVAEIELPKIDGAISPDGKTLALPMRKNDESTIEIWDIPPRKPLRWVLGLLAIPSVVTFVTIWKFWSKVNERRRGAVVSS